MLARQHVQGRQELRPALGSIRGEEAKESLDRLGQGLGLLVPVHHQQQRALGGLPQQHRVERLGGGSEPRQGPARDLIGLQPAHELLEGRITPRAQKQIADCWVGQV